MVFVSKNLVRKCKYCEKDPKTNLTSGRNKGYYRTCGSKECLKRQYNDQYICRKKGKLSKPQFGICQVCKLEFNRLSPSHKFYCTNCVPDKGWRARARRYGIGKPQWDEMLNTQNGTCALCKRIPEVVDHCHSTLKVRGLLCNFCNTSIKFLDMGNDFIKKSIDYVGGNYSIQK